MHQKAFTTLEFHKVKEQIAHRAISSMAKDLIIDLVPMDDLEDINIALTQTTEMANLILKYGAVPIRGIHDIRGIIKRLEVGGTLSIIELMFIADVLRSTKQAKSYYNNGKDFIDTLSINDYFVRLNPINTLYNEITRCIISEEEVADDASSELLRIRHEIKSINSKIKTVMNRIVQSASQSGYLQDNLITMRNDRYCVPVKAEYRSQFKGMIHDQSSTGSTLFIEPLAVVELNNTLSTLFSDEKKEIQKILVALSELAGDYKDTLKDNIELLTQLDFIMAKSLYSIDTKCSCPIFNDQYDIYLEKARHPLLDPATVVPTTIYLGKEFTTLVVTGPNTGGKTVTLKTLGLLSIMGQSGLHIPAFDGARLTVLDNVFADIGDEQSIEQSLSTFSSHMTNITFILANVTDRSLVLFDELGAGTDPVEGAALAMAILENLREAKILTAATTHYSELKVYALTTEGVENASCEFDVNTLRPTYKLLIGIPGKSNAFAISKRLGLSDYIIDAAKEFLNGHAVRFEDLITDLETNRKTALIEKDRAEEYRKEAESLKSEIEEQRSRLAAQKKRILDEAKSDALRLLENAKSEADGIIKKMNDLVKNGTGLNMADLEEQRANLREKLKTSNNTKQKTTRSKKGFNPQNLEVGDLVFVTTLNQKGTILALAPQKQEATVQIGIMKSKVPFDALDAAGEDYSFDSDQEPKYVTGKKYTAAKGNGLVSSGPMSKNKHVKPELDLRGTNTSEALELVDKYLDDAYLAHLSQVTLIHGKGTGILRQNIHQYLRTCAHVKSYRLGNFGEGDSGVTVVEFND